MKGVEGHLCDGFSKRLRCNAPYTLSRIDNSSLELALNLPNDPIKRFLVQSVVDANPLDSQSRPKQDMKQVSGVVSSLDRDGIFAREEGNLELIREFLNRIEDVRRLKVRNALGGMDVKLALSRPDESIKVDTEMSSIDIGICKDLMPKLPLILTDLLKLIAKFCAKVKILDKGCSEVLGKALRHPLKVVRVGVNLKVLLQVLPPHVEGKGLLRLQKGGIHAILTIRKLDDAAEGVSYGAIVLDDDIFKRFDQAPLNVASLRSLYSSIDQTLSPSHGMEKHLLRCQALSVGVLDKTPALSTGVVLEKVGQGAALEAVGDTAPFNVLLTHKRDNLTQVDVRTLGP
mmetsp:Transcript_20895/g.52446  ORF Transcript_20895/g.52446 Transcript_20895/m.52446 type:complete len:344 (+) Transcript_20895:1509-2540(+)